MAKTPRTKVNADDMLDLTVAVEQLTEETRLLRMSLDELRDDVIWAARQVLSEGYRASGTSPPPPVDPLLREPAQPMQSTDGTTPTIEHAMDGSTEFADAGPYCCDKPRLMWNGDPDAPGIACEHCGYVVAELGSVVIWRGDEEAGDTEPPGAAPSKPRNPQGTLFGDPE